MPASAYARRHSTTCQAVSWAAAAQCKPGSCPQGVNCRRAPASHQKCHRARAAAALASARHPATRRRADLGHERECYSQVGHSSSARRPPPPVATAVATAAQTHACSLIAWGCGYATRTAQQRDAAALHANKHAAAPICNCSDFLIAPPTPLPPPPASHLVQPAARAPTGALDGFFGVQRNLQERHTAVNDEQEGDGAEVEHCRGRRKPPGRLHA